MRLLIQHNISVDFVDNDGWTALHLASRNGHLNIVRLLIEHNAPVDLVERYETIGWKQCFCLVLNGTSKQLITPIPLATVPTCHSYPVHRILL
ncbi:hypothetical protein B0H14DRAFT_865240 [Mycena olivaceomarginata]|nr:hypothetical protein B0H14DRAFT_865240 [Mycena olivaceomarginata]